ncbi:phage antirepressor [Paramuricea clavata]|uniref:Phage antirepressor n=1 Tax=Paramuricea clavata TaxID=317549 RepID=A0A7D9IAY6_PARCT|nr:phage antirepressor [Paramuricea clavata]
MEKLFRNRELNVSVRTVRCGDEVLFYAKDVAESLGYANPQKAVRDHVWKLNKEVLPSIRKTGSYELPDRRSLRYNQMILINETDLHNAIVSYIRDNYPEAVILPGLGEYQDTMSKRCDAWKKGYKGGQPDLIIENPMGKYKGFAIEFKSPKGTGVISENQDIWFRKLRGIGYMTMVSDDLVKTCIRINEYFGIADTDVVGTSSLKKTIRKAAVKKVVCDVKTYKPRFNSGKY